MLMFSCQLVNLLCVNLFLSEGWLVWGLGEWFALVKCGEKIFIEFAGR